MAVALLAAVLLARAPEPQPPEFELVASADGLEPTVTVMQPVAVEAAYRVALTGTVFSLGQATVVPQASGAVVQVADHFRAGARFRADETLAQIDTADYEIAVALARADLAVAQAQLLEVRGRPADDGRAKAAAARVEGSRQRLRLAEIELDRTRVRMPFDGYVVSAAVSVGQVVTAGSSAIGVVYARNQLRVRARISTADLQALQPVAGSPATVVADGRTYAAEVERQSRVVDVETRLASLYLRLLDQEAMEIRPLPGTFAEVTVEGLRQESVFLLPDASMRANAGIWLVEDRKLVPFRPVAFGHAEYGWMVRIFDPLDGVVVGPIAGARAGLGVEPVVVNPR